MRKTITKKTAIRACVLIFVLIAILSIFPFRIWTGISGFSAGGERVESSEYVNYEYTLVQKFITQYDRLSSVDLYISEVINGRYISVSVAYRIELD